MGNRRLFSDNYFDLSDHRNNIVPNETVVWMRPRVINFCFFIQYHVLKVLIKGSC